MPEYVLTKSAESDLIEIARYTRREWGERQRNKYIRELFDLFAAIAAEPQLSQNRDRIRPDLKSRQHKKTHTVYFRIERGTVQILRVLHVRQDVGIAFIEETDDP